MRATPGPGPTGTSTREQVLVRARSGEKPRPIAEALGLTTQAVYWHLTRLRAAGELPPAPEREGAA